MAGNDDASQGLRVLVADGSTPLLGPVVRSVEALGHRVISEQTDLGALAGSVADPPDVALVIVGESSEDALAAIAKIARDADFPVIAILHVEDRDFIDRAARLGIFAHIVHAEGHDDELQASIEIALHRFAEYHALQGAFGRRAITERAKGILMERHSVDEQGAFNMIREQARRTQRKVVDVAGSVLESHRLLASRGGERSSEAEESVAPD